jgi:hypothetical protein
MDAGTQRRLLEFLEDTLRRQSLPVPYFTARLALLLFSTRKCVVRKVRHQVQCYKQGCYCNPVPLVGAPGIVKEREGVVFERVKEENPRVKEWCNHVNRVPGLWIQLWVQ